MFQGAVVIMYCIVAFLLGVSIGDRISQFLRKRDK